MTVHTDKTIQDRSESIARQGMCPKNTEASRNFINSTAKTKYTYNFDWLGRPIIQLPQDIIAMQELIWKIQPDLIIETGIAHGGSLIFSASMLELNAICGGPKDAEVVGIDIDIRKHNRKALEEHPLYKRIRLFEGSSIDSIIVEKISTIAKQKKSVLVCLDSNHTHDHVLAELEAYAPMTTPGSYCVVFDTVVEDMPAEFFHDRPWAPGNSPKTAIRQYLREHPEFEIDKEMDHKLLISVAPDGYLKRIR
jgi:cephalosporin hydroxylase